MNKNEEYLFLGDFSNSDAKYPILFLGNYFFCQFKTKDQPNYKNYEVS